MIIIDWDAWTAEQRLAVLKLCGHYSVTFAELPWQTLLNHHRVVAKAVVRHLAKSKGRSKGKVDGDHT